MRRLTENDLLALWERGRHADQNERALLALRVASSPGEVDDCTALSIGDRDGALMALQRATFGPDLGCFVVCGSCGEQLEFSIDLALLATASTHPAGGTFQASDGRAFRLPTTDDLIAIEHYSDVDAAALALLRRCCTTSDASDTISDALFVEIDAGLARLDGFERYQIDFTCAACDSQGSGWLDASEWLWKGIERGARRALDEIHTLAGHYGWSEDDILRLSPIRRRDYIDRCLQ